MPLKRPARSNIWAVVRAVFYSLHLARLMIIDRRCELMIKTCRSGLRMATGDRFRDVYFDGLLAKSAYSYIKIEEINSSDFNRQAAAACYPAAFDSIVFTFWGKLLAKLLPVQTARNFCEHLARQLGEIGVSASTSEMLTHISSAYWQSRIYGLLLRRLRPDIVLVTETGEYGLSIACKRHGIHFIELQHGVFDAEHPDAIPEWVSGSPTELILPDILACRGEYWIKKLVGTLQGRDHARTIGNELIDLARSRRARRKKKSELLLVVSSQGLDSERLAQWIADCVRAAPNELDWQLVIKLHPINDNKNLAFDFLCSNKRITVIKGEDQPNIFDLLADADLHMSIASACHFDAAALGVASIVIPLSGYEAMLDSIDGRLIHLACLPSDPWTIRPKVNNEIDTWTYSTPHFISNMADLIFQCKLKLQ